jgi:hypothetical protein
MNESKEDPEILQLGKFLSIFNTESDRGAALTAAAMLDERLVEILASYFTETKASADLLDGFNAPLGTFSSRTMAALALGLIEEEEMRQITIIRKIRNEFGHTWDNLTFNTGKVADLAKQLPWRGPQEFELTGAPRGRFNTAVAMLLVDLLWRSRLAKNERRTLRTWARKTT